MKYLLLTITVVLIASCSGGGSQHQAIEAVQYTSPVSQVTIKGDSMAAGGAGYTQTDYWSQWGLSVENDGVSGTTIEWQLNNPDHRQLQTLVLFMGHNSLVKESVQSAVNDYGLVMNGLTFTKLICVGIPYGTVISNADTDAFNAGVKLLCPHYVDTSDALIQTIDGVHPDHSSYMIIGQRIGVLL